MISPAKKRFYLIANYIQVFGFSFFKWLVLRGEKRYAFFQKKMYDNMAKRSSYVPGKIQEYVVGASYDDHNAWRDYDDYLMKYADDYKDKLALDFATGPGRNIIKYHRRFKRLDGVDISEVNIRNAKTGLAKHSIKANLYVNNGMDLAEIPSDTYHFLFSSIALQHICSHSIRQGLFKEFYRVLALGGRISIQMGFGLGKPNSVGYFDNDYLALKTNGGRDTRVESAEELRSDLESIGFRNFEYWIRPPGPGETHPNWIFFTATK